MSSWGCIDSVATMEPVREEDSGVQEGNEAASPPRSKGPKSPPFTASRRANVRGEQPSLKYKHIDGPSPVLLRRAESPPRPTLPRRQRTRTWQATAKERNPLASSLTGTDMPCEQSWYGDNTENTRHPVSDRSWTCWQVWRVAGRLRREV